MATAKKYDLEVHFLSLELSPALKLAKHTNHLLGIDLVCPRPTVARKSSERVLALEGGVFAPASQAWTESVVFKETINGRFGIAITISEALTDAVAESFFRTGASTLVKFLAGFAGAAVTVPNLDDIADIPFSSLTKALGKDRSPATIVRGCFDFPADASFPLRTAIEVPLVAAGDIFRPVHRTTKAGDATSRQKILSKGEAAGVCRLALEVV